MQNISESNLLNFPYAYKDIFLSKIWRVIASKIDFIENIFESKIIGIFIQLFLKLDIDKLLLRTC